jgi:quinol monooxygenase YgiN
MLSLTTILRAKKGREAALRDALVEWAEHVRASEPRTAAFFVMQETEDPRLFTTYARFEDRSDLAAHDDSWAKAAFAGTAKPLIDGAVSRFEGEELAAGGGSGEKPGVEVIPIEDLTAANDE